MMINRDNTWQYVLIGVTVFTTLFYALVTGHIWEDFFITFRFSQNLVEGHGLVYQPGEHVYGFTSVINTLLPALYYWITGRSVDAAIWLYRLSSIAALVFGAWYFLREFNRRNKNTLFISIVFSLLFAFEAKTIMFTTNGQEAGFMALFFLPSLVFAFYGFSDKWKWAGLCWAGLMYTRPDGIVYIVILAFSAVVFGNSKNKDEYIAILKAALLCGVLYLPWFIWAWVYYGSPVPHTIIAKSSLGQSLFKDIVLSIQAILSLFPFVGPMPFRPTYFHFGGWPYWINVYSLVSWLVCTVYWLIPSSDKIGRFASLMFTLLTGYFALLQFEGAVYPWYLPPAAMLGNFILVSAAYHFSTRVIKVKFKEEIVHYIVAGLLVLISVSVYFSTVSQISVQESVIENGNRKKIGLWLNENKKEGDTVFLEPLGYIGFYSKAKMLDFPGLVAPEVVKAQKKKIPGQYDVVLKKLEPSWVVLRPGSYKKLQKNKWFIKHYNVVKVFDARKELERHKNIYGINYLYFDSVFIVLKRE